MPDFFKYIMMINKKEEINVTILKNSLVCSDLITRESVTDNRLFLNSNSVGVVCLVDHGDFKYTMTIKKNINKLPLCLENGEYVIIFVPAINHYIHIEMTDNGLVENE